MGTGCDGGACDGGPCAEPVLLVPAAGGPIPNSLASDGTYLYWSIPAATDAIDAGPLTGAIYRKPIDDAAGPGTKVVGDIDPVQIVAGATFVAWIDRRTLGTGVYTNPSDGGPPTVYLYPDKLPAALIERAGTLYWSIGNSPLRISIGLAATPGNLTGTVYPGNAGIDVLHFAVDDDSVYLTNAAKIYKAGTVGSVDAGAVTLYDLGLVPALGVLADPTPGPNVYWTTGGPPTVNVGSKDGGAVLFTHSAMSTSNSIDQPLADGSNVYWFESDGSCGPTQIWRMPAAGGPATPVATPPAGCILAAQDPKNIFWIRTFTGDIYRWAK
jgi:hypothetical protein